MHMEFIINAHIDNLVYIHKYDYIFVLHVPTTVALATKNCFLINFPFTYIVEKVKTSQI